MRDVGQAQGREDRGQQGRRGRVTVLSRVSDLRDHGLQHLQRSFYPFSFHNEQTGPERIKSLCQAVLTAGCMETGFELDSAVDSKILSAIGKRVGERKMSSVKKALPMQVRAP